MLSRCLSSRVGPAFALSFFLSFIPIFMLAGTMFPDESLEDPLLEARAEALGRRLRCLVCRNQMINESEAPLARDLRLWVRARLSEGQSDRAILDGLRKRYGDFVLMRPGLNGYTVVSLDNPSAYIGFWVMDAEALLLPWMSD